MVSVKITINSFYGLLAVGQYPTKFTLIQSAGIRRG